MLMSKYYSGRQQLKENAWQMVILQLCFTQCLHRTRHKHCDNTHVSLWIWSSTICRWSHIERGSKYVALLDGLFYKWLGQPAGIGTESLSPPSLQHARVWAWEPLLKSQMSDVTRVRWRRRSRRTIRGARGPRFSAGDGKNTITEVISLWSAVVVTSAPW